MARIVVHDIDMPSQVVQIPAIERPVIRVGAVLTDSVGPAGKDGIPGRPGADGQPGRDGVDGKSAYQVALQNGFQGSEQDWLRSLKGEKGDPGQNGAPLRFEDLTSTQKAELKGERGAPGRDGQPGRDGERGQDGRPGRDGQPGTTDYNQLQNKPNLDNLVRTVDGKARIPEVEATRGIVAGGNLPYLYGESTTPASRAPYYIAPVSMNARSMIDALGAYSGQEDLLYLAHKKSYIDIKSANFPNPERLFNGDMSSSVIVNSDTISEQSPAWVSVEFPDSSNSTFGASDVIRLSAVGHRAWGGTCVLKHYKIEVKGKLNTWHTIVERKDVNDDVNMASWALHVDRGSYDDGQTFYHTIKGFRLTIYSLQGSTWDRTKAYIGSLQMRDTRPSAKPSLGIGAVDIGGSNIYGDLNMVDSHVKVPTGSSITFNRAQMIAGTGFPEGVVSAPVGSVYTDENATSGAICWIKKTGTGSTGWAVMHGDTGWIKISSWGSDGVVSGATLPANAGVKTSSRGGIWIRRENYNIHWRFAGMRFVGSAAFPIPAGFNCDPYFVQVPVVLGSRVSRASIGTAAIYMGESGVEIDSDYAAYVTYKGTSNWPTNLPRNV